ncbi:MAG TPA: hypothetical protein VKM55_12520 [Candidatus Lokiarchaeia archaeon]|nr:hypothetical protein [Candidatus Lokiarchaeia archaeon]
MGNKPIDWEAIQKKPGKDYKLSGTMILDFRKTIESQKEELTTKSSKIKALEDEKAKMQADLEAKANDLAKKIETIEKERDDKIKSLEQEMATKTESIKEQEDLNKQMAEKLDTAAGSVIEQTSAVAEKDACIEEKDARIAELENELAKRQDTIQQLESLAESAAADKDRLEQEIKSMEEQQDTLVNKVMDLEDKIQKPARVVTEDDMETVRACNTCKQYVLALEEYKHIQAVKLFDATHRGHMLATLTYGDVKDDFTSKTEEYLEKIG